MNKHLFYTAKKTKLYWELTYSLGGHNPFNGEIEPRGYSISLQRQRNEFGMLQTLDMEQGAVNVFLHEVKRQSATQELRAYDKITNEFIQEIANLYNI